MALSPSRQISYGRRFDHTHPGSERTGRGVVSLPTKAAWVDLGAPSASVAASWLEVFPDFVATFLARCDHWVLTGGKYLLCFPGRTLSFDFISVV